MTAYMMRNYLISYAVVLYLMKNPGMDAPKVKERMLTSIPVKVMIGTFYTANQVIATLLGVLITTIFPIEMSADPRMQKIEFST